MKYIYGPVKSRRLGLSLGISLTVRKTCSFDCVYCQLGVTTNKTSERREYVKIEDIIEELKEFLKSNAIPESACDYISFSGFGEPTLNSNIGDLIKAIKGICNIPLALITNSSLLINPQVRNDVLGVDLILPSLDGVTQDVFQEIDRPLEGLEIKDVINGLIALRGQFQGKIYLEIMLIKGINDSLEYAERFKEVIQKINPDKVQLNIPLRPPAEIWVKAPDKEMLAKIRDILGFKCEII